MEKCVVITGTPGVGKTVIARELGSILNRPVLHLGELIIQPQWREELTQKGESPGESLTLKPEKVKIWIQREIAKKGWSIIESHFADLTPPDLVSHCVLLRTHPTKLQSRLEQKKWDPHKIQENVQAEILGSCVSDALASFKEHPIIFHEVDTTESSSTENLESILDCLKKNRCCQPHINWLEVLSPLQLHRFFNY